MGKKAGFWTSWSQGDGLGGMQLFTPLAAHPGLHTRCIRMYHPTRTFFFQLCVNIRILAPNL